MKNLNALLEICMKELDEIKIPYTKPNYIEPDRAKKRWGCCHRSLNGSGFSITITKRLCDDNVPDDAIKKVIIHELLHTCPDSFCHTGSWLKYANIVKQKLGYDITRTDSAESLQVKEIIEPPKYKYILTCEKCGTQWKRMKKSDFVQNYRFYHCNCGGNIQRKEV